MSAPQALKDALIAMLDEAYDADGVASARVPATGPFVRYDDSTEELPDEVTYKVIVDASASSEVVIRIRPRSTRLLLWPF